MPGEQGTPGDVGAQVSVNTVKDRGNCLSLFSLLLLFWTISTGDRALTSPLTPPTTPWVGLGDGAKHFTYTCGNNRKSSTNFAV